MDRDCARSEAFVRELATRLKLDLAKPPWNPNSKNSQSGANVALLLSDGNRIGVQVTEVDPFREPGARGREKAQTRASALGVFGNFAQNDATAVLHAIRRAVERKTRIAPSESEFGKCWLLMCTGMTDAPTSTFIPTPPLGTADLEAVTAELLLASRYTECFLLPFFATERSIYRWSRNAAGWEKRVLLEGAPLGSRDVEYVRELLRTRGRDKTVVDARVKEILDEIRDNPSTDSNGLGAVKGTVLDEIRTRHKGSDGLMTP